MKSQELVRNYLKKFPNTPSLSIAKKIYAENSADFKDVEAVRSYVRTYRGTNGKLLRKEIADKSLFVPKYKFANPFHLPDSDAREPETFILPKSCDNILILSDLHIPYHNIEALTVALNYGKKNKINTIFINGDLMDFYQISRFVNLERRRSVAEEIEIAKEFLRVLKKEFPHAKIYFLKGNHDLRLEMYLATKAPELLDVEEFRLQHLLEAEKFDMEVIPDTTKVKMGKLLVTHGHLLLRGVFSPVNTARGIFLKAKTSVLVGHSHKVSTHSETTMNDKVITCYSIGCLCELTPTYAPFANNYTHGFAHVVIEKGGRYKVRNLQILKGELIN